MRSAPREHGTCHSQCTHLNTAMSARSHPMPSPVFGLGVATTQGWMLWATVLCGAIILAVFLLELLCKSSGGKSSPADADQSQSLISASSDSKQRREAALQRGRKWLQVLFLVYLVTFNLTISAAINESHRLFGDLGFGSAASGWLIGLPVGTRLRSN
jgi:hypothetical protein